MTLSLAKNIWNANEDGIGHSCINIYEGSSKNPKLWELLEAGILKEKHYGDVTLKNKALKGSQKVYGPLVLEKIDKFDFKQLTYDLLIKEFEDFCREDDWGDDLDVFHKNFEIAICDLNEFDLTSRDFFLINTQATSNKKLLDPNFYAYFVCVISTQAGSNIILTLTFGLD
ncbi:MAG: hypothetical protein AAFU57_17635 [Bacteroidota bacterium]